MLLPAHPAEHTQLAGKNTLQTCIPAGQAHALPHHLQSLGCPWLRKPASNCGEKKNNPGKTEVVLLRKQESFLRNAERHPLINQEPGSLSGWFSTSGALSKGPSVIWGAWSEWQMRRGGCVGSQGSVGTAWGEPQSPAPGGGTARSRHLQWCASCVCRSSKEKSLALNVVFDVFFVCK